MSAVRLRAPSFLHFILWKRSFTRKYNWLTYCVLKKSGGVFFINFYVNLRRIYGVFVSKLVLILFLIPVCSLFCMGAVRTGRYMSGDVRDTVAFSVYFHFDSSQIDTAYMDNGKTLDSVLVLLSKPYFKDTLTITAAASPDGKSGYNRILSRRRAESLRNYLMEAMPGLSPGQLLTDAVGEDWAGLKALVLKDPRFPQRDIVLEIIDSEYRDDTKEMALRAIPGMFGYLVKNHLYYLRSATFSVPLRPPFDSVPALPTLPPDVRIPAGGGSIAPYNPPPPVSRKMVMALRTNLLVPAMNVGVEVPVGNSWSVAADYYFPWIWPPKQNRWCVELLGWSLEGRYWFGRDRTAEDRLSGHSVGLYAGGGYYDFEKDWKGVQGEYMNVGVDYLYALPVGRKKNLRFEFTLGVGYIRSWVRPYEVKQEYGDLIKDTQEKRVNWFGPTKLAVSFVVPIYMKDKKGGAR